MDIVRFKGGLGNQMFQYAFAEALRYRGREVACNTGFYRNHGDLAPFILKEVFPDTELNEIGDMEFQEWDAKWKLIKQDMHRLEEYEKDIENQFFYVEKEGGVFDERVFKTQNCVFVGYWQTEKYFCGIKQIILDRFTFSVKEEKLTEYGNLLKDNYYSVHIRRGDYLKSYDYFGGICTEQYYKNAMEYIKSRDADAKFVFFSDDMAWVKCAFGEKEGLLYLDRNEFNDYKDWYDMYLMTRCKGNIVANSSFSWWGAWLNRTVGKTVVSPKRWFRKFGMKDIWCDGWMKI